MRLCFRGLFCFIDKIFNENVAKFSPVLQYSLRAKFVDIYINFTVKYLHLPFTNKLNFHFYVW